MLLWVVLGITFGTAVGVLNNVIVLTGVERVRAQGGEPLRAVGKLFGIRMLIDLVVLIAIIVLTQNVPFLISAAFSITGIGNLLLILWLYRKGGKL